MSSSAPYDYGAIICLNCGRPILFGPVSAFLHTTHLQCPHCSIRRTLRPAEAAEKKPQPEEQPPRS